MVTYNFMLTYKFSLLVLLTIPVELLIGITGAVLN